MKLNTIVQAMTLTLSVTVIGGVYFLYQQWNGSIRDEAYSHINTTIDSLHDEVSIYLEIQAKPVKTLASLSATSNVLIKKNPENFRQANHLLDTFCTTLDALTCYIMDSSGTTVASSNRNSSKSFIGKNYSFRPYFKKAINGKSFVYLALGVTSKKRGIYFSHPIVKDDKIIGVTVIKLSVDRLEQKFSNLSGIAVLGDPNGVVFATNHKEWLFKGLWEIPEQKAAQLQTTRQFGNSLPVSVGMKKADLDEVISSEGHRYLFGQKAIANITGWEIYYFYDEALLVSYQSNVLKRIFGSGVALVLLFLTVITFYFYIMAKKELRSREQAEQKMLAAQQVAELASQAKSEFLSRMSHEFRTPLNAILGFSQILELKSDQLDQTQKSHVKDIVSAGRHLLDLINEVLDMAKIESGSMQVTMTIVSIDELLHDCLSLIRIQAAKLEITLVDEISGNDFKVLADNLRLKQVLLNLLSNAVKYNSSPGCITLSSEVVSKRCLRIKVSDTGEGLSQAQIDRLFHSFDRLTGKDVEGTGIGLVISKGLIDLMEGKMGVESSQGHGSTFWIELELV